MIRRMIGLISLIVLVAAGFMATLRPTTIAAFGVIFKLAVNRRAAHERAAP
jgi:hypothetical protein